MTSRKPDFRLSIIARDRPDTDAHRRSVSSPRSPRFHEDFNAPFSEAIMNASRTTLATNFSDSDPSSNSRHSQDADSKRRPHAAAAGTPSRARLRSPSPHQLRQDSFPPSEAAKANSVNDIIRDWARRSFALTRKQSGEVPSPRHRRPQSKAPNAGPISVSPRADSSTAPSPD